MSDKDDLIVAGVNQKDKGIWRDFYNRYYAALCSYVEKILFLMRNRIFSTYEHKAA